MSVGKLKVVAAVAGAALLLAGVSACSSAQAADGTGGLVAIAMPTKSLQRWNNDGAHLDALLKGAGYTTNLQYADNKPDEQIAQIADMIKRNPKVLVIAAVDGTALGPVLAQAKAKHIVVIAYDRLIIGTPNVDYYATFDNYKVGQLQGQFIADRLDLKSGKGPFNLEPFAGSPDDNNARFFFAGAWDVLAPYIAKGQLVVPSGKAPANDAGWSAIGIQGWTTASAKTEMDTRLASFYQDKKVQVVLSPNDSLALGIEQSLAANGYEPGADWPLVTGQDADTANVTNILSGRQSMTVWKDTRTLGDQVAEMIDQIVKGKTVMLNDTTTYSNGAKVVAAYLLPPQVVTRAGVQTALVDSGFLKASDVGL
jgi:putative multiple sugar transport system substrate-binding protein